MSPLYSFDLPVFGVVGYKNVGKTTLIANIVRIWSQRGKRIATIKHDAHEFRAHPPGTDTAFHMQAGAICAIIASPDGHVAIDRYERRQPTLPELIQEAAKAEVDVILVEGYKNAAIPKWILLETTTLPNAPYSLPEFVAKPDFQGTVMGFVVPVPPLIVTGNSAPVYLRDNLTGIIDHMEQIIQTRA